MSNKPSSEDVVGITDEHEVAVSLMLTSKESPISTRKESLMLTRKESLMLTRKKSSVSTEKETSMFIFWYNFLTAAVTAITPKKS